MKQSRRPAGWRGWQRWRGCVVAVAAMVLLGSCAARNAGPYQPLDPARRDTARAEKLNQQAAAILTSDPAKAEALLREALTADLYLGPAHNNLGVVYLGRGELYAAAGEFEWARKLMPGRPDPRMNLALTLELAGRTGEALGGYAAALEVDASHIETIQALARLQMRTGRTDGQTASRLDEIALRGTTERWRTWASQQRLKAASSPGPGS